MEDTSDIRDFNPSSDPITEERMKFVIERILSFCKLYNHPPEKPNADADN